MAEMSQEEINAFVEGIVPFFEQEPIADDADQVSWPRLDRGLSDVQDMKRFQHLYGIFDRGGRPFWLTDFRNEDNTALLTVSTTTGTAECTMRGAFQMMRRSRRLHFPMPPAGGGPVTYYVTSEYSPVRASEGGDPIAIVVTTGPPSYSQGRDYIVHWELTRNPNELLSEADVVQIRPKVSPSITVDRWENRPPSHTQLWGTRMTLTHAHDRGREFIADGGDEALGGPTGWLPINAPVWHDLTLSGGRRYPGHGLTPQYAITPHGPIFKGRIAREYGDFTNSSDGWTLGWPGGLYEKRRFALFQPVVGQGTTQPTFGRVSNDNGSLLLFPQQSMNWVDLSGLVGYWT